MKIPILSLLLISCVLVYHVDGQSRKQVNSQTSGSPILHIPVEGSLPGRKSATTNRHVQQEGGAAPQRQQIPRVH
jgi:hypothetical protein